MKPKPCPCCGSKRIFDVVRGDGWGNSAVGCLDCGLEVEGGAPCAGKHSGELAMTKWNRRVARGKSTLRKSRKKSNP